jgi:peroxisomal membrane protein 4
VERGPGLPEREYHALVAGAVGGYFVWGRYSSVNHQVVLYLASRVLVGLGKKAAEQLKISHLTSNSYPLFAAAVWGLVMVLFEESPHMLHSSLKKSMEEIYRYKISENQSGHDLTTTV